MRFGRRAWALAVAAMFVAVAAGRTEPQVPSQAGTGVLLLAHGGSAQWNDNVRALASRVDKDMPTEVAFGMATRANIQTAVDALAARGVKAIVAVPLFVSSYSSVVTSTEYLLGLRPEAPADLALFAKMSHGPAGHAPAPTNGHEGHTMASVDGYSSGEGSGSDQDVRRSRQSSDRGCDSCRSRASHQQ